MPCLEDVAKRDKIAMISMELMMILALKAIPLIFVAADLRVNLFHLGKIYVFIVDRNEIKY